MRYPSLWNDRFSQSPWRGLLDMQRNLDRMFETTFEEEADFRPTCEIEEKDSHFMVSMDVPGIPKKDLHIEVKDGQISVSGERKNLKFSRMFSLPAGVDADKIEAQYQDGVLSLAIPKSESAKARQIKITEGKSGFFSKLLGGNKEEEEARPASAASSAA